MDNRKREFVKFACVLSAAAGALLLAVAYLLIWQETLFVQALRFAAAIACIVAGGMALFAALFSLPILWKKDAPRDESGRRKEARQC